MIALCSKCYIIEEVEVEKKKFSTKGSSKVQNEFTWKRFKAALEDGKRDLTTNRGFRMIDGRIVAYEQQKLGLRLITTNTGCCRKGSTRSQSNFTFS